MPASEAPVLTAIRVLAAAIRSGAVTNPIPGRLNRMVPMPTMDYGIAESVGLQTGIYPVTTREHRK